MSIGVTLDEIERLCWSLSGWRVEQRDVDALLRAVQTYAGHGADGQAVRASQDRSPLSATDEPSGSAIAPQAGVQGIRLDGLYRVTLTPAGVQSIRRVSTVHLPDPDERVRTCRKCGDTLPITMFSPDRTSRGGRKTACTPCENTRRRNADRARRQAAQPTGGN